MIFLCSGQSEKTNEKCRIAKNWLFGQHITSDRSLYRRPNPPLVELLWRGAQGKFLQLSLDNLQACVRFDGGWFCLLPLNLTWSLRVGLGLPFLGFSMITDAGCFMALVDADLVATSLPFPHSIFCISTFLLCLSIFSFACTSNRHLCPQIPFELNTSCCNICKIGSIMHL